MIIPQTEDLVKHCVSRINNRPPDWVKPFPVHHVSDFFPEHVMVALRALPVLPKDMTGARAHNNANRFYFNHVNQEAHPVVRLLASVFQHQGLVKAFSESSGAKLDGSHLLLELACDTGPSVLVPHRDIGMKRFTGLFYLSDTPSLQTAGTDFYTEKTKARATIRRVAQHNGDAPREYFESETRRPLYGPGLGYYFVPSDSSWHGFDGREITGLRKTLIVNYLDKSMSGEIYRNTHNLCFADQTVHISD